MWPNWGDAVTKVLLMVGLGFQRDSWFTLVIKWFSGQFLDKEACETMGRNFMKFEMNKYFTFKAILKILTKRLDTPIY